MNDSRLIPLIGVTSDAKDIEGRPFHTVGDKYVRAVAVTGAGTPLVVPALDDVLDIEALVGRLDGLVLTGAPSNVHPTRYGSAPSAEAEPFDEARDATAFPLIEAALDQAVPLLALCRGFQELNVALGGTLHARLHEVPGKIDHRRPKHADVDVQYGPNHAVTFVAGGDLEKIAGAGEITVNSLHNQGIDRLAKGLIAEAHAPDGTIEAARVRDAKAFAVGVQWHPEYKVENDPFGMKLFKAFGDAARVRAAPGSGLGRAAE